MRVIPVIDLKAGVAVHARGGERSRYAPVRSVLTEHAENPVMLARAYESVLGTRELYVADLDAIGGGRREDISAALLAPGRDVWLDAGVRDAVTAGDVLANGAARVIVGLETLASRAALKSIATAIPAERMVLSMDLRNGIPLAGGDLPRELPGLCVLAEEIGVRCLILLDLARVGSGQGLDLDMLHQVRDRLPGVELVAGGGVGGMADLHALAAVGCDAALVATALHDGRVRGEDVRAMALERGHGRRPGRGAR